MKIEEHLYSVREEEAIKADLSTYLKRHEQKEMLRFLVAGSVDDGKSTLIGRLLYDSKLIYQDHLNAIYRDSRTYNTTNREIDLSLLTDGLKAEREQGITIDVAYRYFSTEKRSFIICDAPGHEQYTRNMATGASHCNLALILIDASQGIKDQTRRHSLIASLMGVRQIVVLINKMDIVDYQEEVFRSICSGYNAFSNQLDLQSLYFIPVSALDGDNIVKKSNNTPWYQGKSLLKYMEEVPLVNDRNLTDFRFPVQTVIRPDSKFRGYAGSIVSGVIHKGDLISVLPSGQQTRIQSIETPQGNSDEAFAPMPVVLTTCDEVDISRGCILAKVNNLPHKSNSFTSMLVWMDNEKNLQAGNQYLLKSANQLIPAVVNKIHYKYDLNQLMKKDTEILSLNDIGEVEITTSQPLVFDSFSKNKKTGSFILIDRMSNQTCAGGMILEPDINQTIDNPNLTIATPRTIWLTGLSGAGKSTIAEALYQYLKEKNIGSYILDGDELRKGLNNNLGFSPEDRKENVRRTAEVAKLLNNAGLICIVALISPYVSDRKLAKDIIGEEFVEIFINTDIETCRKRDPKGLYKRADTGEIKGFTGIDAPYEEPKNPDIIIDTTQINVKTAIKIIINNIYAFYENS